MNLLATRPVSASLLSQAAANDFVMEVIPFIEVVQKEDVPLKRRITQLAAEEALVVFTSINSVRSVGQKLSSKPLWSIACLEGATQEGVVDYFGKGNIIGTAKDSESLSHLIIQSNNNPKVVFFCGNNRMDNLPQLLRQAGNNLEEIVVYETRSTPVAVEKYYDGILFFSPSAVTAFFSINTIMPGTVLFAIGNTTAKSIARYSKNKIMVSGEHTQEAMMNQIIAYYKHEE